MPPRGLHISHLKRSNRVPQVTRHRRPWQGLTFPVKGPYDGPLVGLLATQLVLLATRDVYAPSTIFEVSRQALAPGPQSGADRDPLTPGTAPG